MKTTKINGYEVQFVTEEDGTQYVTIFNPNTDACALMDEAEDNRALDNGTEDGETIGATVLIRIRKWAESLGY